MTQTDSARPPDAWQVICLCAQWCGACREWRALFDAAAAAHPQLRFSWVDIEDQADTVGDVDIETFPTLLVAQGAQPLFYGPVLPSQAQLHRLLASLRADPRSGAPVSAEAAPLLDRLARM
jgi:thioredoxin-like negative regulator of GroEL